MMTLPNKINIEGDTENFISRVKFVHVNGK